MKGGRSSLLGTHDEWDGEGKGRRKGELDKVKRGEREGSI